MDVDFVQKLREEAGLLQAPLLHAVAKSQHVWLEDLSLPFLEFLRCSSRLAFRNEPNGNSLC